MKGRLSASSWRRCSRPALSALSTSGPCRTPGAPASPRRRFVTPWQKRASTMSTCVRWAPRPMVARPRAQGGTKSWSASTPASWNSPKPWPRARRWSSCRARSLVPSCATSATRQAAIAPCCWTRWRPTRRSSTCSPDLARQLELHRNACPDGQLARRHRCIPLRRRGRRGRRRIAGSGDDDRLLDGIIAAALTDGENPGDAHARGPGVELCAFAADPDRFEPGLVLRGLRLIQREAGSVDLVRSNAGQRVDDLAHVPETADAHLNRIAAFIADDAGRLVRGNVGLTQLLRANLRVSVRVRITGLEGHRRSLDVPSGDARAFQGSDDGVHLAAVLGQRFSRGRSCRHDPHVEGGKVRNTTAPTFGREAEQCAVRPEWGQRDGCRCLRERRSGRQREGSERNKPHDTPPLKQRRNVMRLFGVSSGRRRGLAGQQLLDVGDRAVGHFLVERQDNPLLDLLVKLLAESAERLGRGNDRQSVKVVSKSSLLQLLRRVLHPPVFLLLVIVGLIHRGAAVAHALLARPRRIGLDLAILAVLASVVRFGAQVDLVLVAVIAEEENLRSVGDKDQSAVGKGHEFLLAFVSSTNAIEPAAVPTVRPQWDSIRRYLSPAPDRRAARARFLRRRR